MHTMNAEFNRPAGGVLRFHAAQRWIGLLGGVAFLGLIALGVWGIRQWEDAARSTQPANGTATIAVEQAASFIPPVPTFITAAVVGIPEPQSDGEAKPAEAPRFEPMFPPSEAFGDPQLPPRGFGNAGLQLPVLRRIRAPRDAMVKSIHVKSEQIVQKGEVLMVLTSETLEWQMIEVRGQMEIAEAKLLVVAQKLEFVKRLVEKNAASQEQFLEIQAEVQVAQAELKTRKSQYDLVTRSMSELNILAPVDGKIHAGNLEANLSGNPVDRGDLLLEIVSADETGKWENR